MDIYLVGGAVRDQLLQLPSSDRDWVVVGSTPEQMLAAGYQPVGQDFPVFLHPESHEEHALARTERKSGHGYTGFDVCSDPTVTLEEDLVRRDLTINAMAQNQAGAIIDPYGGQKDLQQRQLRHVSLAFVEDPLRVLRVARFAARLQPLGFEVAAETLQLMRDIAASGELAHLTAERVWKETERALQEKAPQAYWQVLAQSDALAALLPELLPSFVAASTPNNPNAQDSLLLACQLSDKVTVRLACLLRQCPNSAELASRFKAPRQVIELCQLLQNQQQAYLQVANANASELLNYLSQLDPWRKQIRFEDYLLSCQILLDIEQGQARSDWLKQAVNVTRDVNPKQFVEQGLKGAAIGTAVKQRREQILANYLTESPCP